MKSSRATQERLRVELEDARSAITKNQQQLASTREAAAEQLQEHRCKVIDLETEHQRRDQEQSKTIHQLRHDAVKLSNELSRATNEVSFAKEQLKHEKLLHQSEIGQVIAREQNEAMAQKCKQENEIALLAHRYDDAKRLHEQDKHLQEKLHADAVRKLQIEVETHNQVHIAECKQVEQQEIDAIRRLQNEHGRELRSANEGFETHERQFRTDMGTIKANHNKTVVSED